MANRRFSFIDHIVSHADNMLRTLNAPPQAARSSPASDFPADNLTKKEAKESARLMRVNHTGEVCAQALYQGQSLMARSNEMKESLRCAAEEENDHLAWCEERIKSLNGKTSKLNPLFYVGSYAIGATSGFLGDRISAAFLAETEYQVAQHLDNHLQRLPRSDNNSRIILKKMRADELKHAKTAENSGATSLPFTVRALMQGMSKIMTGLSYRI